MSKIVCISDVHGKFANIKIPKCDLLISTGDYSFRGTATEVRVFHEWLENQPAKNIISLQGNHELGVEKDFYLSKTIAEEACPRVHFIEEGLVEIDGLKIWCSAITRYFCNWAYNRQPGDDIQKHWDAIPEGIDILATHGPAYGILDSVAEYRSGVESLRLCGCPQLLKRILEVKPKAVVFGHIHEGRGHAIQSGIDFINASICDEKYKAIHKPIEIDFGSTVTVEDLPFDPDS